MQDNDQVVDEKNDSIKNSDTHRRGVRSRPSCSVGTDCPQTSLCGSQNWNGPERQ